MKNVPRDFNWLPFFVKKKAFYRVFIDLFFPCRPSCVVKCHSEGFFLLLRLAFRRKNVWKRWLLPSFFFLRLPSFHWSTPFRVKAADVEWKTSSFIFFFCKLFCSFFFSFSFFFCASSGVVGRWLRFLKMATNGKREREDGARPRFSFVSV